MAREMDGSGINEFSSLDEAFEAMGGWGYKVSMLDGTGTIECLEFGSFSTESPEEMGIWMKAYNGVECNVVIHADNTVTVYFI